jgi:hypothetical protein
MAEAPSPLIPTSTPLSPRLSTDSPRQSASHRRSIILVDHTKLTDPEPASAPELDLEQQHTEQEQTFDNENARQTTFASLKKHRSQRKYHRYGLDRLEGVSSSPSNRNSTEPNALLADDTDRWGQSHLRRGYRHVQDSLRVRKQARRSQNDHSEIDVMYENERGLFTFGIPHFSSKALMPMDPAPWVDANFQTSRVNITNAQVPDPSWQWAWKTWYVDMSGDVDEEGWEYSYAFSKCCAWHGNHPWFHSYVRRRRWIRKRVRKHVYAPDKAFGDAHMMNQDYFTIHEGHLKSLGSGMLSPLSADTASESKRPWAKAEDDASDTKQIESIGALINALKDSPVDSERITAIHNFLENGGDEVYYLADEVSLSLALFPSS